MEDSDSAVLTGNKMSGMNSSERSTAVSIEFPTESNRFEHVGPEALFLSGGRLRGLNPPATTPEQMQYWAVMKAIEQRESRRRRGRVASCRDQTPKEHSHAHQRLIPALFSQRPSTPPHP